ncbi:MAG: phospholipid carrier-dependent glycosyltransferase [Chloroflexi bacterium]|nr:phospholipid carrier-dependent glycosyltransferase [Chloroflexota bacterium]
MSSNFITQKTFSKHLAITIIVLGFLLRIYRLGNNVFWIDELGVAQAAFQNSIQDALEIARSHVMAMPLDYVVAWVVAKISHEEGWLRLPEAIWGTLTLPASYLLFKELSDHKKTVLLATFLLAISPIHIQYSQELRFYAPLTFFYIFSTWLGIKATKTPTFKNWAFFTLSAVLGLFFHFYVLLALVNIGLIIAVPYKSKWQENHRIAYFTISALIILLFFMVGLFFFGSTFGDKIPLFLYETFFSFLFTGLGWLPPIPATPLTMIWGILCMGFAITGIAFTLKRDLHQITATLFYSMVIQISLIVFLDLLKNYFVTSRQLLIFVPIMLYFTAQGVHSSIEKILKNNKRLQNPAWIFFVIIFALSDIPILNSYYSTEEVSAKNTTSLLASPWQPEETTDTTLSYPGHFPPRQGKRPECTAWSTFPG